MTFTSLWFIPFFILVFLLYWFLPAKYRNVVLLAANYVFYASLGIPYVIVLFGITALSFLLARFIEVRADGKKFFVCSIVLTFAFLFVYKYLGFSMLCLNAVVSRLPLSFSVSPVSLVAPIGISYYTFQAVSYLADVYKKKMTAEKNFLHYAVYMSFFPTVTSGPIERAGSILRQLKQTAVFDYQQAVIGIEKVLLGCFKKRVIADHLGTFVGQVGNDIYAYDGFAIVLASLGFTLQLYCDFSGYSDMAIGLARVLHIEVHENFKSPYFSSSVQDFWSRWHISLSGWLKEYLYIPLGGNRCSRIRNLFNIFVVFLLSGAWHGAGIKYLIWGSIHGLLQCMERIFHITSKKWNISSTALPVRKKLLLYGRIVLNFIVIDFTWIVFWLPNTRAFLYAVKRMFYGISDFYDYIARGIQGIEMSPYTFMVLLISILLLAIYDFCAAVKDSYETMPFSNRKIKICFEVAILFLILFCNCVSGNSFIYAQY